jgi:transposase-like protein
MFTDACIFIVSECMVAFVSDGEREEITAAAIAREAGVVRAAVSNWRRRYPEFPKPVGGSPTSPTFDRAEVEAWLKATGKSDQLATAGTSAKVPGHSGAGPDSG